MSLTMLFISINDNDNEFQTFVERFFWAIHFALYFDFKFLARLIFFLFVLSFHFSHNYNYHNYQNHDIIITEKFYHLSLTRTHSKRKRQKGQYNLISIID